MRNKIKLDEIINYLEDEIIAIYGSPEGIEIKQLSDSKNVDVFTLDWINPLKSNKQDIAKESKARAIIADPEVIFNDDLKAQSKVLFIVNSPKLAIAKIGNNFFVNKLAPGIHHSAKIDPGAVIGDNIYIGANVIIGKCTIGDNTVIHNGVIINDSVTIGKNVIVKSGAVIGQEGFGFERLEDGRLIKFPQLGGLIIEDNVEIGSNTCIDRGSLSDTIVGKGSKINNLCHIAHNVVIGQNVIITAQVNISGSTVIEDNVWVAPNATIIGGQRIGKKSVIGAGAVVTKNVPAFETWVGNPAKKIKK